MKGWLWFCGILHKKKQPADQKERHTYNAPVFMQLPDQLQFKYLCKTISLVTYLPRRAFPVQPAERETSSAKEKVQTTPELADAFGTQCKRVRNGSSSSQGVGLATGSCGKSCCQQRWTVWENKGEVTKVFRTV